MIVLQLNSPFIPGLLIPQGERMRSAKNGPAHDVGVIVGRFQVPSLHEGHLEVIEHVCEQHDKVLLFLGLSPATPSTSNPLDFQARKQMIETEFPEIIVGYLKDTAQDDVWTRNLDQQIDALTHANQTVKLYGSRDSFLDHYQGKHETEELEAEHKVSGKEIRKEIERRGTKASEEWREGATWACMARYAVTWTTVDIAIFNEDETRILLARKPDERKWRLPGGFADPTSETFETDARREAMEETALTITDPQYVGSFRIDDWRYRGERDQIKTILFKARKRFGDIRAGDDVEEVRWVDVTQVDLDDIVDNHRQLIEAVIPGKVA